MKTYALILAGGIGSRMGVDVNKVFLSIREVPAIVRAIAPFSALVSGAVVVTHADEQHAMRELLSRYSLSHFIKAYAVGGDTRQQSVANGLAALPQDAEAVLVHDGARPFVSEEVICRVIKSVMERGSGVAAMPVTDTVKRALPSGQVQATLDRDGLYLMQTPQGFRVDALMRAHEAAARDGFTGTDDASLLERAGMPVYLVNGDKDNIKLTTPDDLQRAEAILISRTNMELQL